MADQALALVTPDDPVMVRDAERLERVRHERSEEASAYFARNAARWDELRSLYVSEADVEAAILKAAGPVPPPARRPGLRDGAHADLAGPPRRDRRRPRPLAASVRLLKLLPKEPTCDLNSIAAIRLRSRTINRSHFFSARYQPGSSTFSRYKYKPDPIQILRGSPSRVQRSHPVVYPRSQPCGFRHLVYRSCFLVCPIVVGGSSRNTEWPHITDLATAAEGSWLLPLHDLWLPEEPASFSIKA